VLRRCNNRDRIHRSVSTKEPSDVGELSLNRALIPSKDLRRQ
jgi:hypothetical protein